MPRRPPEYTAPTRSGKIIGVPNQGTHTLGNWESDNAVDIAVPVGTPIYAVANGVIGKQFGSLGEGGRFAGLRLHLKTQGNEFYYAHLSKFAPGIKPGAHVKAGQIIGYSGSANGVAHLHFSSENGSPYAAVKGGAIPAPSQKMPADVAAATPAPDQPASLPFENAPASVPAAGGGIVPPGSVDVGAPPDTPVTQAWQAISTLPLAGQDSQRMLELAQATGGS